MAEGGGSSQPSNIAAADTRAERLEAVLMREQKGKQRAGTFILPADALVDALEVLSSGSDDVLQPEDLADLELPPSQVPHAVGTDLTPSVQATGVAAILSLYTAPFVSGAREVKYLGTKRPRPCTINIILQLPGGASAGVPPSLPPEPASSSTKSVGTRTPPSGEDYQTLKPQQTAYQLDGRTLRDLLHVPKWRKGGAGKGGKGSRTQVAGVLFVGNFPLFPCISHHYAV